MTNNDNLDAEIQRRTEAVSAREEALPALDRLTEKPISVARARYELTGWVVGTFLFSVFVLILFIMRDGEISRANFIIEILKTLLLPLVTLMIGHYFGSKSD